MTLHTGNGVATLPLRYWQLQRLSFILQLAYAFTAILCCIQWLSSFTSVPDTPQDSGTALTLLSETLPS